MKALRNIAVFLLGASVLVSAVTAQNPPESGVVQGKVTRLGTDEAIPDVQVSLEGGTVSPELMQGIVSSAATAGLGITPPAGASLSQVTDLLISTAAARGLPVGPPAIQRIVSNAVGPQDSPTVATDRDGSFVFRGVKPGRYTVRATREGYFGKPANGTYPATATLDVTVAGKDAVEAPLGMAQGAIVAGRIFDVNGTALSNVNVQAFSLAYQTGFALLQPTVTKTTDDRGEYRLFWVPPGEYYVGVTPRAGAPAPGALPSARTYYPGVTRLGDAMPVVLKGGEDLRGVDIGIRTERLFKITGQVSSTLAPPAEGGGPLLVQTFLHLANRDLDTPADAAVANQAGTLQMTPNTGNFTVQGVAPGSYELLARVADPTVGTGLAAFSWGRAVVEVDDRDVADVAITINPSPALKGFVRPSSGAALPPNLRILLNPVGGSSRIALYTLVATRGTPVAAEGGFSVASVPPGRWRVGAVPGLPQNFYIADVRQGSTSVFDAGFDVGSRPPEPIEIVVAPGAGVVEGVALHSAAAAAPGAIVAMVPAPARIQNRALYATATADASGRFAFRGVAPGDYQVFAWEATPPNAYQSESFLRKYDGQGKNVRVLPNGAVSLEVHLAR